jgi:hypothetical protein
MQQWSVEWLRVCIHGGGHVMVRVDGQHPGRCQRQSQAGERSTTRGMANNPNDDMLDWGTRSIPRHNPLRGWGALPTHTRGNAADGVTPGFMAESPWDSRTGMGAESAYHDGKSFVVNDVKPFNHKDLRSALLRPPRKNDPPKCHPHRRECIAQRRRGAESPNPFSQRLSARCISGSHGSECITRRERPYAPNGAHRT